MDSEFTGPIGFQPPDTINEKEVPWWNLKSELSELCELRESTEHAVECNVNRQDIPASAPITAHACNCERGAIETRIKQYIDANMRKVDNIRQYWRYIEDMLAAAEQDYKDATARRASWVSRLEFLKSLCLDVMLGFEEKEKKVQGQHGFIRLQPNGGPSPAPEIYSLALIPEDMVGYRGWMSCKAMAAIPPEVTARQDFNMEREPMMGMIKSALESPCRMCGGHGAVNDDPETRAIVECQDCSGTGKRLVPGARLVPRGFHVRIR